jgi:hypothetical protein
MLRRLAALVLLLAPFAGAAGERSGRLQVSATVVRSLEVSVSGDAAGAALRVRTSAGGGWAAPLAAAVRAGAVRVVPSEEDPGAVVVTILADALACERCR